MRIAVFISPHGFGHAARALAVMEELARREKRLSFEVFTTVPEVFFAGTLEGRLRFHPVESDVGLRQRSALEMDLEATVGALAAFREELRETAPALAARVRFLGCDLVLCDISPLGILVAREARLPSVLLENFTWDWIYEPLVEEEPRLREYGAWLGEVFREATFRIQVDPVCDFVSGARRAGPVARPPRKSRETMRAELGVAGNRPVVLLTMGGLGHDLPFMERLEEVEATFLLTAQEDGRPRGNLISFRRDEPAYLPDLIAASDLVVAKLGYSTVAEVWLQNRPLLYVANPRFRETGVLRDFVERELPSAEMSQKTFDRGAWLGGEEWLEMARGGGAAVGTGRGAGAVPATEPGGLPPGVLPEVAGARTSGAGEVAEGTLEIMVGAPVGPLP